MQRFFRRFLVSRAWPVWARYAVSTALVVLSALVRASLNHDFHGYPFLLFLPAIIISGVMFDRGTGIFATLLSGALAAYFFIAPYDSFLIQAPRDVVAFFVFIGIGLATALLVEALHTAFVELAEAHQEIDRASEQRAMLLQELSHRIRNDLAIVSSLLSIQARALQDPGARAALETAADRVQVLARVHGRLTMVDRKAVVDSKAFITELCDDLRAAFVGLRPIVLDVAVESHPMDIARMVSLGLVINELLTNALKYAFPEGRHGRVTVRFVRQDDHFCLKVGDNGIGIPEGQQGGGMGQRLIRMLAVQLGGELEIEKAEPGVTFVLRFPAMIDSLPEQ